MTLPRPDLSNLTSEILTYIEHLEAEITRLTNSRTSRSAARDVEPAEPTESPTTINVITMTASGLIKRTPRHFYPRQRRAGMGIFDIDTDEDDPPTTLNLADQEDTLLVLTDASRVFTFPVASVTETPVRGRGTSFGDLVPIPAGERVAFIGPVKMSGSLVMVSERGYVRVLRHNYVGNNRPATQLLDVARFGPLVSAGWMDDNEDEVFIATQKGLGIRFKAKMVHPNGSLGIRLERGDSVAAVCGTSDEGSVFLLGDDGKGTIRQMSGFRSNKAPGAGGKVALKAEKLVAALSVKEIDDIFIISKLSKIIRFQAEEIPAKEGTVQGVICMSLRADACVGASVAVL
jgi:DNA gyrase subunit A